MPAISRSSPLPIHRHRSSPCRGTPAPIRAGCEDPSLPTAADRTMATRVRVVAPGELGRRLMPGFVPWVATSRMMMLLCALILSGGPAAASAGPISTVKDAYASWSPDGSQVVFASTRSGNWDIWSIDASGESLVQLTDNEADDYYPAWSPDGLKIAFVSDRETGDYDLFLMDANGRNQRRLDRNPALDVHPMWHPAGDALVFNSSRADADSDNLDIYRIDLHDRKVRRLSSGPMNESLASYSADGKRIIFEVQVPDESHPLGYRVDIGMMPASGGEPELLTNHYGTDAYPAWHGQTDKILFASSRSRAGATRFQLYAMDSDGSNVARLIESPFSDARPSISPDGTRVAFTRAAGPREESAVILEVRGLECTELFCRVVEDEGFEARSSL